MATAEFPVVGIGASAGGLDAFAQLLQRMPADSGMAFVVIQHLDPRQHSILAELLGTYTTMQVIQARDHLRLEPDHVYVIPPDTRITAEGGELHVGPIDETRLRRMPIDVFFRSLAQDCGHRAIGVVLTGTGTDGTLGLKEIKDRDGLAIAQDPNEAGYDGMPRSAIASGVVDLVLPLRQIPDALVNYARQRDAISQPALGARVRDDLDRIIDFLRSATSHNFTPYKPGTLQRRIERRMAIVHAATSADYLSLLERDPVETSRLTRDLLIGVTSFFRDTETYSFLEENVLPKLLEGRSADQPLRIWVPGCSTGEEAYSLAMLLIEQISAAKKNLKIQVFASDINEEALEIARHAIYPESIQADLSRARLERSSPRSTIPSRWSPRFGNRSSSRSRTCSRTRRSPMSIWSHAATC
jgi:two-component system CheB/CheR fusion protein